MMKRAYIYSAESENSMLADMLDDLEDDFDYILAGLEKLDRAGSESSKSGVEIADTLQQNLQDIIAEISNVISQ